MENENRRIKKINSAFPDFANPMQPEIGPLIDKIKAQTAYNDDTELTNDTTRIEDVDQVEGE
jgi:hypothetical protein